MAELLLELLSEEIPARMQARAADDLKRLVCDGLKKAGLEFSSAEAYVTPRRLALVVDGLAEKTPDISEEKRGPATSAPEQAINGFKGSLPEGTKIEKRQTEKGEFFFALVEQKGGKTDSLLADILEGALAALGWQKSMRWGENKIRWVRPLQAMLCLFGGKSVAVGFGPVTAGDTTVGHRFLNSKPFKVKDFADYKAKLEKNNVIIDAGERANLIEKEAKKLASKAKLKLKDDPGLLAEVAGLVEWPVVHMGSIDADFMDLPPEVLTTTMRNHQKYFALYDAKGKLAAKFIIVANTETSDKGKAVIAGNERVLRARLADAKFFWEQDRKHRLDSRIQELGGRVFHAKLGTVLDKVERIEKLSAALAPYCKADPDDAMRAARLAKADLSSGMVGEFPELQGIMGRYYALADGEKPDVADAITEHYAPQGPNDACPKNPLGITVALADKIDTLVGFWAIDEKPTGSKDPFALRRAALGVIRLIIENELNFAVREVNELAWRILSGGEHRKEFDAFSENLRSFLFNRLKVYLRDKGHRHDLIDSLFSRGGEDDLLRIVRKAEVLKTFLDTDNGTNLLTAYRRANNIVEIESKKDNRTYFDSPDENQFQQDEERAVWTMLNDIAQFGGTNQEMVEFEIAVERLAGLRKPVDVLFDHVKINCDD
ncbi:MAG: glycine--tRNA ligase subunit beta, partial [Rhodospirillales bacterium]